MADNGRFVWTEEDVVAFLTLIKEKQITAILDSKQQRNASIYQELRVGKPVKRLQAGCHANLRKTRELVVFTKVRTFDGNTHDSNHFWMET